MRRLLCAALCVLSCAACVPMIIYDPALVNGTVIDAVSGAGIEGADIYFSSEVGDSQRIGPSTLSTSNGEFRLGDRDLRVLPLLPDAGRRWPVMVNIEADGYASWSRQVSGRQDFKDPISLQPK